MLNISNAALRRQFYTLRMSSLTVKFLGSGDAFNAQGRHHAAYLVRGARTSMLLDCGATTLASLKRDGIAAGDIDTILISHLHGDHFAGLPFLFLEYTSLEERKRPLRIVGPPGTEERVKSLYLALYPSLGSQPTPFVLEFTEALPDRLLRIGPTAIEPFQVPHQERNLSLGFALDIDGRRVVYSGDTGWTEDLLSRSDGADLFICECSFFETRLWSHLDYPRLAENRARFGARRIILTHLGEEVLARRKEIEMDLAEDGLTVQV
jgi:ribonuclease BN (tRNA processing enzyme)